MEPPTVSEKCKILMKPVMHWKENVDYKIYTSRTPFGGYKYRYDIVIGSDIVDYNTLSPLVFRDYVDVFKTTK